MVFSYIIYLVLFFSIIFFTTLAVKSKSSVYSNELFYGYKYLKIWHYISIILIAIIVGFRYKVGTDWESYKLFFENADFGEGKIEVGYTILNQIIYNLGGSYTLVFFIVSFLSWYFIIKGFPQPLLPLGIYFLFCDEWFFFSTNGVRQFIAFGIFFYALQFLSIKNITLYLFWIFLAGLFHRTAWLLSFLCLIPWNKLYNRNIWLIIYVFSYLFSQNSILIDLIPALFLRLAEFIPFINIYQIYFSSIFFEVDEISILNFGVVFRGLVALYILYYSKIIINYYPNTKMYFLIFFIGAIITNIFVGIPIISRFSIYFTFLRPFLLSLIIYFILKRSNFKVSKIASYSIISLYFILFLYVISSTPYDFTFLNEE